MSNRRCWNVTRNAWISVWPCPRSYWLKKYVHKSTVVYFQLFISAVSLALSIFGMGFFLKFDNNLKTIPISFSLNRRRWHAGIKACRTGFGLVTLPQWDTEHPSLSSGRTDMLSKILSSEQFFVFLLTCNRSLGLKYHSTKQVLLYKKVELNYLPKKVAN